MKFQKNIFITLPVLSFICIFTCCGKKSPDDNGDGNKSGTDVTVYVTTNSRSKDFAKETIGFSKQKTENTFTLNPSERFQTMDGFGAAITGSSAYNLLQMSKENRAKFLKETFSTTEGMGYSYIRVAIGCSDFSLSEYTCWDNPQGNFGLTDEETKYVIPVLKEILAINPDLKILGSPWTCPIWMKNVDGDGNPWNGGHLKREFYDEYAAYFVDWIKAFESDGIKIYSITPQNEPLNDGNSASLHMDWNEERDFVNQYLVPAMKAAGLKQKVYIWDHNYDNPYPIQMYQAGLTDNETVVGAAYHDYADDISSLNDIHNRFPDKELIFTETSIGTWNDGRNLAARLLADMEYVALGTVNRWCKAVIVWNLMLDNNMGPNRPGGCQTCYGAVDVFAGNWQDIRRNSHYYIIGHLAAVVKPGAVRIGSSTNSTLGGFTCSAFENTDETYSFVLTNNSADNRAITIQADNNSFSYNMPAYSVASFKWKKQK
jgi:glucosylceramidase